MSHPVNFRIVLNFFEYLDGVVLQKVQDVEETQFAIRLVSAVPVAPELQYQHVQTSGHVLLNRTRFVFLPNVQLVLRGITVV